MARTGGIREYQRTAFVTGSGPDRVGPGSAWHLLCKSGYGSNNIILIQISPSVLNGDGSTDASVIQPSEM
ncbi:hypothetical protein chiPu_0001345 [Chiloscyllium punctatum]|uniref:Uncharacterized protein n=1 Tax=Chiloscyllium punctatum TaxID=137246 RepID=A0A401RXR3_CHIPU|nr:hypothetical protein [Chiloscyllium punctatum]